MLKLKDGYYAKNEDGKVGYYEKKPCMYNKWWKCYFMYYVNNIEITESWEDSLYYIKDGVATKVVTFTKDQKVLVRDSLIDTWKRRYYSHEENCKHYVYAAGANSWVGNDVVRCHYIKPYEESNVNNEEA